MKTITKWIIVGSAVAVTTGVTLAVTYYRNKKQSKKEMKLLTRTTSSTVNLKS